MSTFQKQKCHICHKDVSSGGAALTSHMRAHVRKGEAQETKGKTGLIFTKPGQKIEEQKDKPETQKSHYETTKCEFCQEEVSAGGAAFTSHMRSHVRKNEVNEYKRNGKLVFLKVGSSITDKEPFALLGFEQLPGQPKDVWQLPNIKEDMPAIDPSSYFITSGEAVKKAEKLEKDLFALAIKARFFKHKLKKARGAKKYLELARDDNRHLIKAKDPRIKYPEEEEKES